MRLRERGPATPALASRLISIAHPDRNGASPRRIRRRLPATDMKT
ncbi:hypothetical protein BURMUCGD1_6204 [Burkholderia multivorans CGD1]|nr:hypothetical protein BURMUCGD1_6204 [Burkholderia multivorans CGD1]